VEQQNAILRNKSNETVFIFSRKKIGPTNPAQIPTLKVQKRTRGEVKLEKDGSISYSEGSVVCHGGVNLSPGKMEMKVYKPDTIPDAASENSTVASAPMDSEKMLGEYLSGVPQDEHIPFEGSMIEFEQPIEKFWWDD
jgi:hypothetical protein